ncbi:MAG: hypothetical protein K2G51_10765 [Lachnospiraceae bacterium]|nr:hypothetical protein [Lachnospiraceae bacterium]
MNMVPVTFAERTFLDGKAAIWMPEDFEELSLEEVAVSYFVTIGYGFGYCYKLYR